MKLYVLPVENICNGSCLFCINKTRDFKGKEFLDIKDLDNILSKVKVDSIEITGGGEPLLHKDIREIIFKCVNKFKTQIYTNGEFYKKLIGIQGFSFLCLSRMHYLDKENKKIMGVDYDSAALFNLGIDIKLSLVLHRSGISNYSELINYLNWAKEHNVKKVVVRQLFEETLKEILDQEFVSSEKIASYFDCVKKGESFFTNFKGMVVEFELRSCSCVKDNLVLHSDGKLYRGWTNQEYDLDRG